MDDRMQAEAVAAARQLLSSFRAEYPRWTDDRTPVDELVSWVGLEVATFHQDDFPRGTYGFLEPSENLIWLCRGLPETLRRFTLAHELGHVVLHRYAGHELLSLLPRLDTVTFSVQAQWFEAELTHEDPCQELDVQEEVIGRLDQERAEELLGIGQTYNPRSERELAANIFAAELLMPLERVRALYLIEGIPASQLASIFDVSSAALLNRLMGLLTATRATAGLAKATGLPESGRAESPPDFLATSVAPTIHEGRDQTLYGGDEKSSNGQQPDEFQRAAIEAATPALIVAGPGSGKTSTLIGRVEYLIRSAGVLPEHILALTFSRKAAQEMQERLQQVLGAESALPMVSTFHAYCADLLRTSGERVGLRPDFTLVDDAEGYFLLRRLAAELPLRHYSNLKSPAFYFPAILGAISRAKDELLSPQEYKALAQRMLDEAHNEEDREKAEKALEIADIYALYARRLERQRDTDFGGLIMLAVQLLQEHPEVRQEQQEKYQHILVDEFQDINRASGVLLRLLAGDTQRGRVWVVGDINQAIYGFRGASPANIANFRDDYPDAVLLPLSSNYRSRPDIVSFADAFRSEHLEPGTAFGKSQSIRSPSADASITLAEAVDEASELNGLLADIQCKHEQGYAYRDIVVLCRTRAQVRKISRVLALANFPTAEHGGILEQESIKDLLSIVLLLADRSGMGILRAGRQDEHTLTQEDIEALFRYAKEQQCTAGMLLLRDEVPPGMSSQGKRSFRYLSNILRELQSARNVWSLLAQYLFIETPIAQKLLCAAESRDRRAARVLDDYAGLLQLAQYYDYRQQVLRTQQEQEALAQGEEIAPLIQPPIKEQAKDFLDYLNVLFLLRQDAANRREGAEGSGEESLDVIRVMTVHASKGLEFPVVYLPYLVQRYFPIQKRVNFAPAPKGMLPAESIGDAAHKSGEACLFYVGATRARDHLVLSYSERYGKQNYRRSPYLEALVNEIGLTGERISRVVWQDDAGILSPEQVMNDQSASSQPGEDFIEFMKPSTLTVSGIEMYANCPRRYAYSSIYGFQPEAGAYSLFWRATQKTLEVLQNNLEARKADDQMQVLTPEEVQDLYIQHWQELGGHEFPFASLYEEHGREVMKLLWDKLLESGETSWQLRQDFTVEVAGKTITVTVDGVEAAGQGNQPVKFISRRFGKRKEKPPAGLRELLYAHAYRQHYPGKSIELHFQNMSTGETFPIKLTGKKEQSLNEELEQAILGLERNEFPPKPDLFICPMCPFFFICPA